MTVEREQLLADLERVLRTAEPTIKTLTLLSPHLFHDDVIIIEFQNGYTKTVNITGNSALATIVDVANSCLSLIGRPIDLEAD